MVSWRRGALCLALTGAVACGSDGSGGGGAAGTGASAGSSGTGAGSGSGGAGGAGGSGGSSGGTDAGPDAAGGAGAVGGGDAGGCDANAADSVGDGVDQNCDAVDGVDGDGDGIASTGSGGTDCDDANSSVFPGASEGWNIELVDLDLAAMCGVPWPSGCASTPQPSSMVTDANGKVHLALGLTGKLAGKVAWVSNASGAWSREVAGTESGSTPQVAVAPDGSVYVAYVKAGGIGYDQVRIASRKAGAWSVKGMTTADLHNQANPRIAADGAGALHVVATNRVESSGNDPDKSYRLYYATSTGGFVAQQVTTDTGEDMVGLALAVTSGGVAHASYLDRGTTTVYGPADPRLRYWALPSTSPPGAAATADAEGTPSYTSLALAADGTPHVSYLASKAGSNELRIATLSGTWSFAVVPGMTPSVAPIAVDSAAKNHLCVVVSGALHYLSDATGTWKDEVVTDEVTSECQIAIGPSDVVHLTFRRGKLVRHATRAASPGTDRNCNGSDDT